jgi:hypothetical protein
VEPGEPDARGEFDGRADGDGAADWPVEGDGASLGDATTTLGAADEGLAADGAGSPLAEDAGPVGSDSDGLTLGPLQAATRQAAMSATTARAAADRWVVMGCSRGRARLAAPGIGSGGGGLAGRGKVRRIEGQLVEIAPHPVLARFAGLDDRMVHRTGMPGGMAIR